MQAFITGVSTGIGYACVEKLIHEGVSVVGTVRNAKQGDELRKKWGDKFQYLVVDVCDYPAVEQIPQKLKNELKISHLDLLVNNSGVAVAAPFLNQDFSEVEHIINVNLLGLMKVTQVLLPLLGAQADFAYNPGRIINISSVAGRMGTPFLATYVASKHAVEGFSHSLRRELMPFGVDVVIVGPGSVKTPIWQKGMTTIGERYQKSSYSKIFKNFVDIAQKTSDAGLEVEKISNLVWRIAKSKHPRARYAIVPDPFRDSIFPQFLNHRLLDYLVSKVIGLNKGLLDKTVKPG